MKRMKRISVASYIKSLVVKLIEDDIMGKAAGVSFYILTTFFPCILIIFISASVLSVNVEQILLSAINIFPADVGTIVRELLINLTTNKTIVVVSAVMAMWTMSSAIVTIGKSLNVFYGVRETRKFYLTRFLAVIYALLLLVMIMSTMTLIVFAQAITGLLERHIHSVFIMALWRYARVALLLVAVICIVACLYKYMPNKKIKFAKVVPGAVVTTVLWIVSSYIFSVYVNNFAKYHILYGSIAGIVILITWTYMISLIILFGGEINALLKSVNTRKEIEK